MTVHADTRPPRRQALLVPEGLEYQWEPFDRLAREGKRLLLRHFEERGDIEEGLDPQWDRYFELARLGVLRSFTVRDSGVLCGYVLWLLTPSLYSGRLWAQTDVFWLAPEWREGWTGVKLLSGGLPALKKWGVYRAQLRFALDPRMELIAKRLGFELSTRIYDRTL